MASSSPSSGPMLCSLKSCLEAAAKNPLSNVIAPDGGRVEVRAFEPKPSKKKMVVNWQSRGEAQFHRECWNTLLYATKGTYDSSLELTDLERSMVLEAKKTAEYHDSHARRNREAAFIANILKQSRYPIAFTGAGISTAAGIGDFRGKDGKWTDREKLKNFGKAAKPASRGFSIEQLRPTYTHEALVKLVDMGLLRFIISQNTDGLHRLSGITGEQISELHGNSFVERCENCPARYHRNLACRRCVDGKVPPLPCPKCNINHRTGRMCSEKGCNGYLMNTIINFGDYLESDILSSAKHHANNADAVLVLGSTLRVSPANGLVLRGRKHGPHKLIICNRQGTPYDEECEEIGPDGSKVGSRVYGDCDALMKEVMRQLLPADELQRWESQREQRMVEYGIRRSSLH